jgi:hypothetical protein
VPQGDICDAAKEPGYSITSSYGKDVVTLINRDGKNVLKLYQVKCGDISKRAWWDSKHEMDELFQVPMPALQLPVEPDRIEGILVVNGHANTFAEPAIEGWLKEQRDTHGRSVEFMHLDALVAWISEERLFNELRIALKEENIDVGSGEY